MDANNHLIKRVSLELEISGNDSVNIPASFQDFFQNHLMKILEDELDKFNSKEIIQIDKWELDFGELSIIENLSSSRIDFTGLEEEFRKQVVRKLEHLEENKGQVKKPLEILAEVLIYGKSDSQHFIENEGLSKILQELTKTEMDEFIQFIKQNSRSTHIIKRLLYQLNESDLDYFLTAVSKTYSDYTKILIASFGKQIKGSHSITERDFGNQFRTFWTEAWVEDKDISNASFLAESFLELQKQKLLKSSYSKSGVEENRDLINLLRTDEAKKIASTKLNEKVLLISYVIENSSLPKGYLNLSQNELKSIFLTADWDVLRAIQTKLPQASTHLFWKVIASLSSSELKELTKIAFADKASRMDEIVRKIMNFIQFELITSPKLDVERALYEMLLKIQTSNSKSTLKLDKELRKELLIKNFSFNSTSEKVKRFIDESNKLTKEEVEFSKLISENKVKDYSTELLDVPKSKEDIKDNDSIEIKEVNLSELFISDLLDYYFLNRKLPWWSDRGELLGEFLIDNKNTSDETIIHQILVKKIQSDRENYVRKIRDWMMHPRSRDFILFKTSSENREIIVNAVFPRYYDFSFIKLIQSSIKVLSRKSSKHVYVEGLFEELMFQMIPEIIAKQTNDIKTIYGTVFKVLANVFEVPLSEFFETLAADAESLSTKLDIGQAELTLLFSEIDQDEKFIKENFESNESSQNDQIPVDVIVQIEFEALYQNVVQFLKGGGVTDEVLNNYDGFKKFLNYVLSLKSSESNQLKELLKTPEVKQFVAFLDSKYPTSLENDLQEYDLDVIGDTIHDNSDSIENVKQNADLNAIESLLTKEIDLSELTDALSIDVTEPAQLDDVKSDMSTDNFDDNEPINDELKYYKSNLKVLKEVLGYVIKFKELPWWSPYQDFSEWQYYYKELTSSRQVEFREYLNELFENEEIQHTIAVYLEGKEAIETDKEAVTKELVQFQNDVNEIMSAWSKDKPMEVSGFYQALIELFGNNQDNLPAIRNALLSYQSEKFISSSFDADLITMQANGENDQDRVELIEQFMVHREGLRKQEQFVKAVELELKDWLAVVSPDEDLTKLFSVWLKDIDSGGKVTEEVIEELILRSATYLAIKEQSSQLNVILRFIRKGAHLDFKYQDSLLNISASFKGKDWLKEESARLDEEMLVELVVLSTSFKGAQKIISSATEDVLITYKYFAEIEENFPSLYVLSMLAIEQKNQDKGTLKEAINTLLELTEKLPQSLPKIQKFAKILYDSDWTSEPELESTYSQVFKDLSEKQERSDNFTEKAFLVNQSLRVLTKDKEFVEQLQKIDTLPFEGENKELMEEEFTADWIKIDEGDRIFVANAGMVMLWPFLPALFNNLGYIEDRIFKDRNAQERAVHLLQYIMDGEESSPEFILFLNKVICGIPIDEPIKRFVKLTKKEKEEADSFLTTVISRWEQMKNTSVPVFRETFLQRDGALQFKKENWYLKVEWKAIDILLTKLPWGVSMIKHHWNNYIIFVEWNNKS